MMEDTHYEFLLTDKLFLKLDCSFGASGSMTQQVLKSIQGTSGEFFAADST